MTLSIFRRNLNEVFSNDVINFSQTAQVSYEGIIDWSLKINENNKQEMKNVEKDALMYRLLKVENIIECFRINGPLSIFTISREHFDQY